MNVKGKYESYLLIYDYKILSFTLNTVFSFFRRLARPSSARPAPPKRKEDTVQNEPAMR